MKPHISFTVLTALLLLSLPPFGSVSEAAITLTNGGFEQTGSQYATGLGGLYEATGWINLTPQAINASSALRGTEQTDATYMEGNRFLRLATDYPNSSWQGATAQYLGTMIAGEQYNFLADVFGGDNSSGFEWGATASFISDASLTPTTTYATQTVSNVTQGSILLNGFDFSYTATAVDDGKPLYVLLAAAPVSAGFQARRGGVDNARIVVVPEAGTSQLALLGVPLLGLCFVRRKRR